MLCDDDHEEVACVVVHAAKCYRMNHLPSTPTNFEVMLKIRRWCDVACCCNVISQWDANRSTLVRINDRTWKSTSLASDVNNAFQEAEVSIRAQNWIIRCGNQRYRRRIAATQLLPWNRLWVCVWTLNSGLRDEDERYWLSTRVMREKSVLVLRRMRKKSWTIRNRQERESIVIQHIELRSQGACEEKLGNDWNWTKQIWTW